LINGSRHSESLVNSSPASAEIRLVATAATAATGAYISYLLELTFRCVKDLMHPKTRTNMTRTLALRHFRATVVVIVIIIILAFLPNLPEGKKVPYNGKLLW
jgi:hypothetical protein